MSNIEDCRGYLVHLRLEHLKLDGRLRRIKLIWCQSHPDSNRTDAPPELTDELATLRSNLVEHFAEEEEGGCLEEAVCRCPKLGREADRLENDHAPLLAELDGIIRWSLSQGLNDRGQQWEIQQKFDEFAANLHAHEAAENHLLEVAFGLEAGS